MKKKIIGIIAMMGLSATLVGCGSKGYSDYNDKKSVEKQSFKTYQILVDEKMYYIPHENAEQDLPSKYQEFIKDHPELKIIDVEADIKENTNNNMVNGYFIFTEKKGEN